MISWQEFLLFLTFVLALVKLTYELTKAKK